MIAQLLALLTFIAFQFGTFKSPTEAEFQQGTLRGHLTDAKTGEDIVFANVVVYRGDAPDQFIAGTQSDVEGRYTIPGLELGEYLIKYSFIGYQSEEVIVPVRQNRVTWLDVTLKPIEITGWPPILEPELPLDPDRLRSLHLDFDLDEPKHP